MDWRGACRKSIPVRRLQFLAIATLLWYQLDIGDRLPMRREAELLRNLDRLDGIRIGIASVIGGLVSQLIWTCSWMDRLEAIQKRLIEIDKSVDSLARVD